MWAPFITWARRCAFDAVQGHGPVRGVRRVQGDSRSDWLAESRVGFPDGVVIDEMLVALALF